MREMPFTYDFGARVELAEVVLDSLLNVDVCGCENVAGSLPYGRSLRHWVTYPSERP